MWYFFEMRFHFVQRIFRAILIELDIRIVFANSLTRKNSDYLAAGSVSLLNGLHHGKVVPGPGLAANKESALFILAGM